MALGVRINHSLWIQVKYIFLKMPVMEESILIVCFLKSTG